MLKGKKGFIHHPATWVIIAFILGVVVMYLVVKNIIPLNMNFCPTP